MYYLRCLCLLAPGDVQRTLRCVSALLFFVLCTICCQFRSIGQTSIHSYSTEDGHDLIDLQSCFYYIVIGVSILTLSTIVTFVFGIVATVGYFFQIRKQKYIRQYA
jgi:hypothetical protein